MAFTKTEVDEGINMARGVAILQSNDFAFTTNGTSNTYDIFMPAGGYQSAYTATSLLTLDAVNGTITSNGFAGKIEVDISGSLQSNSGAAQDLTGHVFLNSTDQEQGFRRTIGSISYGSFGGGTSALTIADGDVITFKLASTGTSQALTVEDLKIEVEILGVN
jgi:hypothetical protein